MTTYALEVKELPGQNPAATPPPSNPVHNTEAPAWSGDVYQEGDESAPEQSQWSFTGEGGEEAWLDRSQDGTITGWVRDPDGTVYRYTDPDAWAVDVDDAGLAPQGAAAPDGDPAAGEDPNAATDPTQGDDYADESEVDEDAAYDEYANGDPEEDPEADPDAADEGDEPTDDETDEPAEGDNPDAAADAEGDDTPDGDEDEDDEEQNGPPFAKKKKPGFEAKVYRLPYA